jgi:hypothetical protein
MMVVAAPSHASMQQWCAAMEAAVAAAAGVAVESLDHGLARKRTAAEQAAVKEQVAARARELVPGGVQGGGGDVGALSAAATAGSGAQAALPGAPPSSSASTGGGGASGTPAPGGEPAAAQEQVGAPMLSVCRCVAEVKELSLSIDESRFTKVRGLRLLGGAAGDGSASPMPVRALAPTAPSAGCPRTAHCPRPCSRLPAPLQVGVQPRPTLTPTVPLQVYNLAAKLFEDQLRGAIVDLLQVSTR